MGCFIQIIYGIFNFENPWDSIKDLAGVFHNTGIWGGFVGVSIVILLYLIFYKKQSRIQAVIPWILIVPLFIQLISSHSRASWMGLVVTILYLLENRFAPGIKALKPGIKVAVFVVALLFFAWGFQTVYSIKPESATGRLYIWTISARLFKENPVFGIGIDRFRSEYMPVQAAFFSGNPDSSFKYIADDITNPFNEFLKTGVEQGLTGVLILALLFYFVFVKKGEPENPEAGAIRKVFISIILYLAVFAFFSYPFIYIQFDIILFICLAGLSQTIRSKPYSIRSAVPVVVSSFMLLGVTILCLYSINDFRSLLEWNRVRNNASLQTDQKITCYESLYPALHHHPQFLMTYSRLFMQTHQYKRAQEVLDELNRYQVSYVTVMDRGICYYRERDFVNALACFQQASDMIPSRFKPDYMMIQLYLEMKNNEKAKEYIARFLARPIKINSPELDRMMEEVIKLKGEIGISTQRHEDTAFLMD